MRQSINLVIGYILFLLIWPAPFNISKSFANLNSTKESFNSLANNSSKQKTSPQTILFLGNSLTAGYGLPPAQAFPNLIQQKIDSLGWNFVGINAGLSGETSTAGLRRLKWLLRRKVDVLVLELGGNDVLRGFALEHTKKNLQAIIDTTKNIYPDVKIVIAGMQAPPNLGQEYTRQFRSIFPELAKKNDALLIPFLLEGVGGVRELNLPDGIHPTAEGHEIVADNVWTVLKPLLEIINENTTLK